MPQVDGKECIPKISHCENAPLSDQPTGLNITSAKLSKDGKYIIEKAKYYCEDCYEGYYWDERERFCSKCSIDNCVDCSDENKCVTCSASMMVTYYGDSCQPRIKDPHCLINFID